MSASLLLAAAVAAQTHDATTRHAPSAPPDAVRAASFRDQPGLHRVDGELWGGADRYKVRFDGDRVTFTPALPPAPRNQPVEFAVLSYGRGSATLPVTRAEPTHDGLVATYARPEFVETWELRGDGCKQSFRFDRLPEGTGDLVVRLRMTTGLQVEAMGPDHLQLVLPGIGGMHVRDVVGIDARGERAAGSLQFADGLLELRLPAAFVERAALPLVLDPLVGSAFLIATFTQDEYEPDVAYDATNDTYLVVFTRVFSSTDYDVHGQRVNTNGSLNGSRLLIENAGGLQYDPAVANVNGEDAFCVVYRADSGTADDIMGRAVRASDGVIGAALGIANTANNLGSPDVGGEATTVDDEAIVVWVDFTTGDLHGRQVTVNGTVSPPTLAHLPFGTTSVIAAGSTTVTNFAPAISKSGGDTGNHLIVWNRQLSTSTAQTQIRCAMVSRDLQLLDSLISPAFAAADRDTPDVDGDGRNWIVAYDVEPTSGSGDSNLAVFAVGWNPGAALGNQGVQRTGEVVIASTTTNEYGASVCWTGEAALVTWNRLFSGTDYDVYGRMVDLFTCAGCGALYTFDSDTDRQLAIRAASQRSGGDSGTRCLAVWTYEDITSPPSGTTSEIEGRMFDADDGRTSQLGGGCGNGGIATFSCMRVGNSGFAMRLLDSAPSSAAFLLMSFDAIHRDCGPCRLVPDPWNGFAELAPTTSSIGDTSYALPIPVTGALSGFGLYVQWAVPGSGCLGFDLSSAIFATIE